MKTFYSAAFITAVILSVNVYSIGFKVLGHGDIFILYQNYSNEFSEIGDQGGFPRVNFGAGGKTILTGLFKFISAGLFFNFSYQTVNTYKLRADDSKRFTGRIIHKNFQPGVSIEALFLRKNFFNGGIFTDIGFDYTQRIQRINDKEYIQGKGGLMLVPGIAAEFKSPVKGSASVGMRIDAGFDPIRGEFRGTAGAVLYFEKGENQE
ncbi:MAG: hypothetical protein A2096_12050 [Spirochaetes bacterium GWF1_41_5]|nr:MAG: hypothetical protein A2096_12050 [Spirochaetes bacterium GWF1_41_5]HBE02973.1 hypothetical protein [Spirochaetia bacterium]